MEAEDERKRLEMIQRTKEKMDARYHRGPNAAAQKSTPDPQPQPSAPGPQAKAVNRPKAVVEKPQPTCQPTTEPESELVVEKPEPPKPLQVKKDRPAPKPKAKPAPKPKTTREKIHETLNSRSSSASVEETTVPSYLEQVPANNIFKGMPKDFTSFGRTKSKPAGLKAREHRPRSRLISDLEREELEKSQKGKGARVRDYRHTEEQKQKEAAKRTEKARERKVQAIREEAEKSGSQISEEELNSQVDAFMEKRAVSGNAFHHGCQMTNDIYSKNSRSEPKEKPSRNKIQVATLAAIHSMPSLSQQPNSSSASPKSTPASHPKSFMSYRSDVMNKQPELRMVRLAMVVLIKLLPERTSINSRIPRSRRKIPIRSLRLNQRVCLKEIHNPLLQRTVTILYFRVMTLATRANLGRMLEICRLYRK